MNIIESIQHKGMTINIFSDETAESPRENEHIGAIVCFHRRYRIGDKHGFNASDYSSLNDFKATLEKDFDIAVILPVYLYDHSGITIRTTPFDCPWDSGQIGWAYVTVASIKKAYGIKRVSKSAIEQATKELEQEVKTLDSYLRGDFCGYDIEDVENGNRIDSCYGFESQADAEQAAKEFIDSLKENAA